MAPSVAGSCGKCLQKINSRHYLKCSLCSKCYDLTCTNADTRFNIMTAQDKKDWKCQECVSKSTKTDNTNTPAKGSLTVDLSSSNVTVRNKPGPKSAQAPQASDAVAISSELAMELRLFREEMIASRTEMQAFRTAISSLTAALAMCNNRVDELTTRMDNVERVQRENTNIKCNDLEETIASLKMELHDRDQELLCNDVEIAGIPEEGNERALHIAQVVAKKLGVPLEERDIVHAERVGVVRRSDAQDGGAPRPRPLVVRLARRAHRDQLLAAARVRRGVNTADMGLSSPVRTFYVNERLTRHNRQIFYKVRAEASRCHWRFVWTRDGSIYARKEPGAPRQRLRTESDIMKVFG